MGDSWQRGMKVRLKVGLEVALKIAVDDMLSIDFNNQTI
jgi:hypothetical protein